MTDKKYYLCTFQYQGQDITKIDCLLIDRHPLVYVAKHNAILLNHLEVTKEMYDMYIKRADE